MGILNNRKWSKGDVRIAEQLTDCVMEQRTELQSQIEKVTEENKKFTLRHNRIIVDNDDFMFDLGKKAILKLSESEGSVMRRIRQNIQKSNDGLGAEKVAE